MLSRRNVRVKVMQSLYAKSRDESLSEKDVVRDYWKKIEESFNLLLFCLYNLANISRESSADFEHRKLKHLPSDFDKIFTPKLWENDMIQDIVGNAFLTKKFAILKQICAILEKNNHLKCIISVISIVHLRLIYIHFA